MKTAFIGLGSNIDSFSSISEGIEAISQKLEVTGISKFYFNWSRHIQGSELDLQYSFYLSKESFNELEGSTIVSEEEFQGISSNFRIKDDRIDKKLYKRRI